MGGLIKRGSIYYALYYVEKKQKRISLETDCLQVAKKKLRQLESALYHGNDNPLPTKTPIANMITAYIEHMHSRKTARRVLLPARMLRHYLSCPALALKNARISEKYKKPPTNHAPHYIEANCFEQVTTAYLRRNRPFSLHFA
jgi:hypothetical protein